MVFDTMDHRRIGHSGKRPDSQYSPQSVLAAMEKFNAAVGAMERDILVPCRLQDVQDPEMGDLHAAFKLLSQTKVDLLFGDDSKKLSLRNGRTGRYAPEPPKSPVSPTSNGSSLANTPADQNSPPGEASGADGINPTMLILHASLNQNLKNLHAILEQMTEAANKLTDLYLKEVEQ